MKFEEYKQKAFAENPKVKEEYEKMKFKTESMTIIPLNDDSDELKFVPVDDMFCEMMNWAVRYALGRRTYAARDTARYMIRVMKMLDDKTIHVMLRDINEHEKFDDLGDECDATEWMNLKEAIEKEIERRKNNEHQNQETV